MKPGIRACILGLAGGIVVGTGVFSYFQKNPPSLPAVLAPELDQNPRELYQVVESQIDALRRMDYTTAYTFAATGIQEKFPQEQFREMIRSTYPQLTTQARVSFGETRFAANIKASALVFVERNGITSPMIYLFIKEKGAWKIEGVQLIQTGPQDILQTQPQT